MSCKSALYYFVIFRDTYIGDKFPVVDPEVPLFKPEDCFNKSKRVVKFIFGFIFFSIISCCILVSKGTLLFISSQLNKYVLFYKGQDQCGVPVCHPEVECSEKDTVRWIWAMYICQCAPYFVMFIRCVWKICFKSKDNPSVNTVIVVSV